MMGIHRTRLAADEERDEIALLCVCRPDILESAMAEVDRRTEFYGQGHPGVDRHGRVCTPRAMAMQSVAADVARGWLG